MSIIGPRQLSGNQYGLIEERDKYGANDVPVGLTGGRRSMEGMNSLFKRKPSLMENTPSNSVLVWTSNVSSVPFAPYLNVKA